ncbi:hypothetical protein I6A60_05940 [Frankia sp. AgB1.9]|uniref:hypothetical protein n=1 Tax=unclassified Frankia TaxID=2632575 RepID=UPI001932B19B|nr:MULTISPECIES: hypothetical protein [unclassified Frankia]MBL7487459.1 hypothetical protein [Frankia sp. AgW1.1]MBL7547421.1 hypothetical protein [Frankia sp. AgB1.9]MBL7618804.1 hypothetical protein [Frankia sp. AgB1.8]
MSVLQVCDLLDADDTVAAFALARFLRPAFVVRIRRVVRTSVPWLCSCDRETLCDTCGELVNTYLFDAYRKLRACARGELPVTRAGEPLRELRDLVAGLSDPAPTASLDVDEAGRQLAAYTARGSRPSGVATPATSPAEAPVADEVWLRKAWGQLVWYPTQKLDIDLVRKDAVRRGMPARPMRTLDESAARAPLAADPAADGAVRELVTGLHANVTSPLQLPSTQTRLGGSASDARAALERGLELLRRHEPQAYETLVAGPLAARGDGRLPARPAQPRPTARLDDADGLGAEVARRALRAEITAAYALGSERRTGEPPLVALLTALVDAGYGRTVDLAGRCGRLLRLDEAAARAEVARLAALAAEAGLPWLDELLTRPERAA